MRKQARIACLLAVGCLGFVSPSAAWAQTFDAPYAAEIAEAAQRFDIPTTWIGAVLRAESAGDPNAVSSAGAMGLMQIMPNTWTDLRARHGLGADPYDPRDNILAGAAYLRELHDRYGSPGFLAAYNAGPDRYEASLSGRPLPLETRAYVAAIAAADPLAWTRAPLFAARPDRGVSTVVPQSDGLFVGRWGVGSRP